MMTRVAFKMRLRPGAAEAYEKAHDEVWPEVLELIRQSGIRNYSIFRQDLDLFAYFEVEGDPPSLGGEHPVVARWWEALEPLMECEPDGSPRTWPLDEVFHVA